MGNQSLAELTNYLKLTEMFYPNPHNQMERLTIKELKALKDMYMESVENNASVDCPDVLRERKKEQKQVLSLINKLNRLPIDGKEVEG